MAKITLYGFDAYAKKLENLEREIAAIEGEAIYLAAGIVADEVKASIDEIHSDGTSDYEKRTLAVQKEGLKESFGIAPMREDSGYKNVRLGFDGYNKIKTKKYPKGQPNIMIARSINSGTSWKEKQPFFDKAVRRIKAKAEATMKTTIESNMEKIMRSEEHG